MSETDGQTTLVQAPGAAISTKAAEKRAKLRDRSQERKTRAITPATLRAYESDWRHYLAWCAMMAYAPVPADDEIITSYISFLSDGDEEEGEAPRAAATIRRRLTTIARAHIIAGFPDPTKTADVTSVWEGTLRDIGSAPKPKKALLIREASAIAATIEDGIMGIRDRAVFLFGVHSAMRRSEIVALVREDLDIDADRLVVRIRRSKTNQRGALERIRIDREPNPDHCPVAALERWLASAKILAGPVFRSISHARVSTRGLTAQSIALIVKRRVKMSGLGDPAAYAAHSLRHGYATSRALAGDDNRTIRKRTRHQSDRMVERYIHDAEFVSMRGSVNENE